MMNNTERKKQAAREAAIEAKRAWVRSQPKEERHRITVFAAKLFSTAEKCRGKITNEGIGRFMRVYVDPEQKHKQN